MRKWLSDIYCCDCKGVVTVAIPVGMGIVEFLEGEPTCPKCGKATLRLTKDRALPVPPGGG